MRCQANSRPGQAGTSTRRHHRQHRHPAPEGITLDGFVAADDADAKATVLELAGTIGLHPVDVGPLSAARLLEPLAWLNISLNMQPGWTWKTGWKLVGAPATPAALAAPATLAA